MKATTEAVAVRISPIRNRRRSKEALRWLAT
jgi:hypothetical protein